MMNITQDLKELICKLAPIPAPSLREDRRTEFCLQWLHENGVLDAYADEAKNVVCPFGSDAGDQVIVCAHIDTVFSDTAPYPLREENGKLYCPGIGDNTANAAILMCCARSMVASDMKIKSGGLKLVLNTGEEGLGNLAGCRFITDRYIGQLREFIAFDLSYPNVICTPIGSERYRLSVQCEGGHSYYQFGNENAIATLSSLICRLYGQTLPKGEAASFNVGKIEGGTSINTIAEHAEAYYEIRATKSTVLKQLQADLLEIIDKFNQNGHKVSCELLATRPCGTNERDEDQEQLILRLENSIRAHTGCEPIRKSGSTDCNYPASLSVPSVCIGLIQGFYPHTRQEYINIDSLPVGYRLAMDVLKHYFL